MSCVILGAGKIARGFIGHLLYLSKIPFTCIEREKLLAELLNTRGKYTVNILGHSEKNCQVTGFQALSFAQEEEAVKAIAQAEMIVVEEDDLAELAENFGYEDTASMIENAGEDVVNNYALMEKVVMFLADNAVEE